MARLLGLGELFPDFSLQARVSAEPGSEFRLVDSHDLEGAWAAVFFWPRDFTFVCPTELVEFNRALREFRALGAKVFGASVGMKVLERAAGHASGPYHVPSIDVECIAARTNNPVGGAFRGFGADMADAEAARRAGEAAVGDERHLVAHALAIDGGGGRQHLAHAGAAARALVADDEDFAFLVFLVLDRVEAGLFAVEAARRSAEFQFGHAGNLHDRAIRREIAAVERGETDANDNVLRNAQMPMVEVHIVQSAEAPTGVGEPGTPVIGPAVANALFAATGRTYPKLPIGVKA